MHRVFHAHNNRLKRYWQTISDNIRLSNFELDRGRTFLN